jgi:hypothetical protein
MSESAEPNDSGHTEGEQNAWYDEVSARPSTLPEITISMTNFAREEDARLLADIIRDFLSFYGKVMNLGDLDRVWVTYDYQGTLANLERGFDTQDKLTPTNDEIGVGIAMTPAILVDGLPKSVIVLNAFPMMVLTQPENEELKPYYRQMVYTLAHECGHVHDLAAKVRSFPEFWLRLKLNRYDALLFEVAEACWSEYIASRLSAFMSPVELTGQYESTLCEQFEKGVPAVRNALRQYRMHGDVARVLGETSYVLKKILVYAAYLFGQLHGLGQSFEEVTPKAKELLQSDPAILALLLRLESELKALESNYGSWESFDVFNPLKQIGLELYTVVGMEIESGGEAGIYINIPFSEETIPNFSEQLEFLARRSAEA